LKGLLLSGWIEPMDTSGQSDKKGKTAPSHTHKAMAIQRIIRKCQANIRKVTYTMNHRESSLLTPAQRFPSPLSPKSLNVLANDKRVTKDKCRVIFLTI
jgi:hypothetical protein